MELRVLCAKCDAEYKIPEERVQGPARFSCKTCGQEIYLIPGADGITVTGGRLKGALPPPRPIPDPQPIEAEQVVHRLGKFTELKRIASGGMGEIFRAKMSGAEGFQREVALKVLHAHLARDESFANAMVDEAKITVQLHHPNIVQVFNLERSGDLVYLVMEYVPGESLAKIQRTYRRKGSTVPTPMAVFIVAEALEGLQYAHTLKGPDGEPLDLVHRDISPHNIMVSKDGWVKLIDFGIAKATSRMSHTRPGTIKGKFAYMAPEQLKGKSDHRADLFAMGVVLWETLAGVRLFYSSTDVDTLQKVLHLDPPSIGLSRPEIPKNLDEVLKKALAKNPDQRHQSAREFKQALAQAMAPTSLADLREQVDIEASGLKNLVGIEESLPELGNTPVVDTDEFHDARTRAEIVSDMRAPAARRGWLWLVLGLAAAAVGAAAWFWLPGLIARGQGEADAGAGVAALEEPPAAPDGGPDGGPAADQPAGGPLAAELDGGAVAPGADQGPPADVRVAQVRKPPPRPIVLTRKHIGRVLRRHGAALQQCADRHLPAMGLTGGVKMTLSFTIADTGHVQAASLAPAKLQSSPFGACLLGQVRKLRFGRHRDKSVTINFPLEFEVVGH